MPLYKTISTHSRARIYIWQITEPEEELARAIRLTPGCQERMDGMRSALHRRGFLSIRHLLAEAGYTDEDLYYDEVGKPHLKDGNYISITHSFFFTGIIVGQGVDVGIDIEQQRDKILRIAYKYTPIEEYRTLANTDALVRKLTIVWGAKEALYKIYATHGLSFLHHINIRDFSFEEGETSGEILYEGITTSYNIYFLEFEGFTCVYALKTAE